MNVLLMHVPKFRNYYKPIGSYSFINLPPMGLLGLADFLRQQGHSANVIHLGVERYVSQGIDFAEIVSRYRPALIGLDLHWHFQAYDVIEVARQIKRIHPEIGILLGGFTASAFAEEILREFDCVDFIIRGDAEEPIASLAASYPSQDYTQVPNLAYRKEGAIHLNQISFVAQSTVMNSICFTDFSLMKDHQVFTDLFSNYLIMDGISPKSQNLLFHWKRSYPVLLGRGCTHRCFFCGGSAEAQKIINNRHRVAMRSLPSIVDSIRDLDRYGFELAIFAFDPFPPAQSEPYYLDLFERIRELGTAMSFEMERWFLPTRAFLQKFRECLGPDSYITLSPGSHDETLRRRNGLYRYSNEDLEACLKMMDEEGVNCALWFSCGLPLEKEKDLLAMANYQDSLRSRFPRLRIRNGIIEIEPQSEMSRHPDLYGVQLQRETFMDYFSYHRRPDRNHFLEMGYEREGCPGATKVGRFYCNHFCAHFSSRRLSPFLCRTLCRSAATFRRLGGFRLLDRILLSRG